MCCKNGNVKYIKWVLVVQNSFIFWQANKNALMFQHKMNKIIKEAKPHHQETNKQLIPLWVYIYIYIYIYILNTMKQFPIGHSTAM